MAAVEDVRRSARGLSEAEFRERFGSEEACRKALFEIVPVHGFETPICAYAAMGIRPS